MSKTPKRLYCQREITTRIAAVRPAVAVFKFADGRGWYQACEECLARAQDEPDATAARFTWRGWTTKEPRSMVAYNFKEQFAGPVERGEKRQTIRPRRKRPTRPGDALQHYTGMRTRKCRKLLDAACLRVESIDIGHELGHVVVRINGEPLLLAQIQALAQADGFETVSAFLAFFDNHYGLPFSGEIIRW